MEIDSIIYDPYIQFTPPIDEVDGSMDKGTVHISVEVIGHVLKALVLPLKESTSYSRELRHATALRALALSPALFTTMHYYKQYPIWPLTFLYFAAGGLTDKARAAAEARSLHYKAYEALIASLGCNGHTFAAEDSPEQWVAQTMSFTTEIDANLLL